MNAKELTAAFADMQAEIQALRAEITELKAQKQAPVRTPKPAAPKGGYNSDSFAKINELKAQLKAGKIDGKTFAAQANAIAKEMH